MKIFDFSMDTIGRHELMGLQAATGYDSACPVCHHEWTSGVVGTQCCFGGYRAFLPERSRGRQSRLRAGGHTYQFDDVEDRPTPRLRTTATARECLTVIDTIGIDGCRGHKFPPLVAQFPGLNLYRLNPPETMHDSKIFVEMFLKTIVGKVSNAGFYDSWCYDDKHRKECKLRGIFPETWPEVGGALPWRLTKTQRLLLDERMSTLIWPARVEKLYYNGASFWTAPSRMWKARRKVTLLYYILPTQLRDQIPAVSYALSVFVWAMRLLMGQVHSYENAVRLGILPGSRSIDKRHIDRLEFQLIMGLVLLSGCLPIGQLNPGMHHFVHFAKYVRSHGPLHLYWMMGFERLVTVYYYVTDS